MEAMLEAVPQLCLQFYLLIVATDRFDNVRCYFNPLNSSTQSRPLLLLAVGLLMIFQRVGSPSRRIAYVLLAQRIALVHLLLVRAAAPPSSSIIFVRALDCCQ